MHNTLTRDDTPPGMPGDDDSPDGGGPPDNRTPMDAIERICVRTTDDLAFLDHIANIRIEIGHLRRQRLHLTADILREQLWCELEAWIGPQRGVGVLDV